MNFQNRALIGILSGIILLVCNGPIQAQTMTISSSGQSGTSGTHWSTTGTNPVSIQTTGDASINRSVIEGYLNAGTSVTLITNQDIRLSDAITKSSGSQATLTINAGRDIYIQANISSGSNALLLSLDADTDNNNIGAITISANITTNGGAVSFKDDVSFNGSSSQAISAGAGTMEFTGEVMLSNTSGITLMTTDANVTFSAAINSGNSYSLDNTLRTWSSAYATYKETSNQYLATITSKMELTAAMSVVPAAGAWLGGSDEQTEGTWKWVTGPETGTVFWTTSLSQGVTGYSGTNGRYVNWNTGEPNDSGSNEDALQIRNNADGLWNDLPVAGSTLASLVETELPPSALTINAGTGTVVFGGTVGAGKPLRSLHVNAATTRINGGKIFTDSKSGSGGQTYSGNITLGSAITILSILDTPDSFILQAGKTITNNTGGAASLTIKNTSNIVFGSNSALLAGTGSINVVLWADTDANGGAIHIQPGASISSNGGNVTLSGGIDYTSGFAKGTSVTEWSGVRLEGSIISGSGSVLLRGQIGTIPNNQNTLSPGGVFIVPSGSITSTIGHISLYGHVPTEVGTGNALRAIRLGDGIASTGQASLTTTSGNIIVFGMTVPAYAGAGILFDSSRIQSGSGTITLTGQKGSGEPDLLFNSGTSAKNISNQILSTNGNVMINGNTLGVWGEGDLYTRFAISTAGNLTIQPITANTTIGIAGATGTLQLPAALFSSSFADGFGLITIGGSTQTGNISLNGVSFRDNMRIQTTGSVNVNGNQTINATKGIKLQVDNAIQLGAGARFVIN